MASDNDSDNHNEKPAGPNFLGRLWKAQVASGSAAVASQGLAEPEATDNILDEKSKSNEPADATRSDSSELGRVPEPPDDATAIAAGDTDVEAKGTTEPRAANSSQFLAKLWKAQKAGPGSSSTLSDEAKQKNDYATIPVDHYVATPEGDKDANPGDAQTILEEESVVEAIITSDTANGGDTLSEFKGGLSEDYTAHAADEVIDANDLPTPAPKNADNSVANETVIFPASEVDALAQRKAALATYERLKEEQRLKTERSKTVRISNGALDDPLFTGANVDHDTSSITRQSFNNTVENTPKEAPKADRSLAAKQAFSNPFLIVVAIAAVAVVVIYFPSASSNYHDGEAALSSGDTTVAIAKLTQAIASNPRLEGAYLARAKCYQLTGAADLAQADCTSAISLRSGKSDAYLERAAIELPLGKFRLAIADIEAVARLEGTLTPALLSALGEAYLGDGQYGKAFVQFSKRLDREPGNVNALLNQARCYEAMNLPRQAVASCDSALKTTPTAYEALVLRGHCLGLLGNEPQALKDFGQAMKLQSNRPEAFIDRALLYAENKSFANAVDDLNTAMKLPHAMPQARYQLASVLSLNGEKNKALNQFALLEQAPDFKLDNRFLINRAEIYGKFHDYGNAIKDLQAALGRDKSYSTECWLSLAACFEGIKDYKQAAMYAGKVLSDEPSNSLALLRHSKYSSLLGNQMTAMADLFKAIEVDPDNPNVYAARGDLYLANKQLNQADFDYRKASQLAPLNAEFKKKLLACNVQTNRARPMVSEASSAPASLSAAAQAEISSANLATLRTKGYQALKSNHSDYAVAALTRAVYLDKNDANARRYLAYALLKMNDPGQAVEQFYAWENLANPDPSSELAFVKVMGMTFDASGVLEHLAERYRTNVPVLLEIARVCKFFNYTSVATSALDFGTKVATSDELVAFNRLRISLQQSEKSPSASAPAPQALPAGKALKVEN